MKTEKEAVALARAMVEIGKGAGKGISALVTDMSQPLGDAVGNALEVREAIEVLQGHHRKGDLAVVSFALASRMLASAGICSLAEAEERLDQAVDNGSGLARLKGMIAAQGGDPRVCDDTSLLPSAANCYTIEATETGYVNAMDTDRIGVAALLLGAGRRTKEDVIDPAVGIWMRTRLGRHINAGEPLADFYVNHEQSLEDAVAEFSAAVHIGPQKSGVPELIRGTVE